jgi:hypothetical protein
MPTVLFFRPNNDLAMQYASSWLGSAVSEATTRGFDVIDMVNEACTYDNLKTMIETEEVEVVIAGGHGGPSLFTGYEQQMVLQACQNDQIMNGTISHFLSCLIGQQLLPSIVSKGGVFTIGYIIEFQFMVDTNFPVEEDPYAEPFKDCTVAIIAKILDGAKLKEVWDTGIAKCNEWIQKLWNRPETDWAQVIACLENNRDGMIGLGDQEAYVMPPHRVTLSAGAALPAIIGIGVLALAEKLH